MRFEGNEVRGADALAPGVYWAIFCLPVEGDEVWLELSNKEPRRNGRPETTPHAWIGTKDGVIRLVWCLVALDKRRRLRRAFPAEWDVRENQ